MSDIWNAIDLENLIAALSRKELPECNRGSWYCPIATRQDAQTLDYLCRQNGIHTVYDLGAGTLELAVEMDKRGYNVIAYESMQQLVYHAKDKLPDNNVEVRKKDYYADWNKIKHREAVFVAIGKTNNVPGHAPNGIVVDGVKVTQ